MAEISIIIPAYNSEKYLEKCLISVQKQSYTDWECIIVDDGSTDGSVKFVRDFIKDDQRFKLLCKNNGGAASARKYGVLNAKSDWILFSDSDDYMPANALAHLKSFDKGHSDIICGTIKYEDSGIVYKTENAEGIITPIDYITYLLNHTTYIGPCSKLIRRNLFDHINWCADSRITNFEDLLMLIALTVESKQITVTNSEIHYVRLPREDSASSKIMKYEGCRLLLENIWGSISNKFIENSNITEAYFAFSLRLLRSMCLNHKRWIPEDSFIKWLYKLDRNYCFNIPSKEKRIVLSPYIRLIYLLKQMI